MSKDVTSTTTDLDTAGADVAAATAAAAKAGKSTAAAKGDPKVLGSASGKKYEITIASTESDSNAVKVAINGEMTLIPRNVRVLIGEDVMEVLSNSVVDVVSHTSQGTVTNSSPRHSVSVHRVLEA